jgi:hypothetical protein
VHVLNFIGGFSSNCLAGSPTFDTPPRFKTSECEPMASLDASEVAKLLSEQYARARASWGVTPCDHVASMLHQIFPSRRPCALWGLTPAEFLPSPALGDRYPRAAFSSLRTRRQSAVELATLPEFDDGHTNAAQRRRAIAH